MIASTYPHRPPVFFGGFLRVLQQFGLPDVGHDGFVLLAGIVLEEDRLRYSRPPSFWMKQLAELVGKSTDTATKTAKKCVETGWLHLERRTNRHESTCWVLIPTRFDRSNVDIDAPVSAVNPVPASGDVNKKPRDSAVNHASIPRQSCGHSVPNPNPSPNTGSGDRVQNQKSSAQLLSQVDAELLRTPSRLLEWHKSAVAVGLVNNTEHDRLEVFSLAERAIEEGKNPAALFVAAIQKQDFEKTTDAQEDRAHAKLKAVLHPSTDDHAKRRTRRSDVDLDEADPYAAARSVRTASDILAEMGFPTQKEVMR